MINICGKFHWNPSTKYRNITSSKTAVNGQTMDGQTAWRLPKTKMPLSPITCSKGI